MGVVSQNAAPYTPSLDAGGGKRTGEGKGGGGGCPLKGSITVGNACEQRRPPSGFLPPVTVVLSVHGPVLRAALAKARQLDPDMKGRGVLQFVTALTALTSVHLSPNQPLSLARPMGGVRLQKRSCMQVEECGVTGGCHVAWS